MRSKKSVTNRRQNINEDNYSYLIYRQLTLISLFATMCTEMFRQWVWILGRAIHMHSAN